MNFDERTERNIATLIAPAQKLARLFMEAAIAALAPHGASVKIISGTRTYAEAMRTIAEAHAAAVQKMAESFTDNLKAQRADLLALRVCRAVDSKSTP